MEVRDHGGELLYSGLVGLPRHALRVCVKVTRQIFQLRQLS